jgi:hypothetical protein
VINQYDNLNNSKQDRVAPGLMWIVWGLVAAVGCAILGASLVLPPALAGRLHPGLVPGALAILCLAGALLGLLSPRGQAMPDANCLPAGTATQRGVLATLVAIGLLALAIRPLGAPITIAMAGAAAALGVRGVGIVRAGLIGLGLGLAATSVFVWLLRQPLPLWPGWWP